MITSRRRFDSARARSVGHSLMVASARQTDWDCGNVHRAERSRVVCEECVRGWYCSADGQDDDDDEDKEQM